MNNELIIKGKKAKEASYTLSFASTNEKNNGLLKISESLIKRCDEILEENKKDLEKAIEKGTSNAMLDRLKLDEERVKSIANAVADVVKLDDPIGEVTSMFKRPNGLRIGVQRVPLGVVGIIYEARPNVTADAAALCLKTGNAVILRGGSEAINSNLKIVEIISDALKEAGLPEGSVQILEDTSRETATDFMRLNDYLDVLIPRGGAGLIKAVVNNATVPVIETGVGNCHIYIDDEADINMGVDIIVNAKTSRPAVCNAAEKLLVNEKIAEEFLPVAIKALKEKGVEIRGCEKTKAIVNDINLATEEDWGKEYLDYILGVKIVKDLDEAISHINKYGTKHSESIVTKNYFNSEKFLQRVDAAAVYVNASTRFTDGGEFGFGAEIGISTQKLHARGPMGLKELTTNKYIIYGDGQIR
ncbi:glutamate-5-semialdehyde dehydrogenase [Clostridium perfringens]|uniref:glutamate-5-semialdehyde dehydrogenase n=1 Tax=Clostridium perfringens TaxID=1502 RepID=UPI0013E2D513|nr:glutamate-5-semialdehyde dehydrogenase [Clostridium perfringens]MCX0385911.1 glutamate-5-semialdehyde dehydrogenase [Clostridium perfringens]MDT7931221.1 glutamate-5-semialdehyde dehydrogenase [Clostridium perfringens]MDT7955854.1 glutamate-5-semialdehyde dehydrogenase [Clostridium perfringens]NGT54704.1 glutamate-5-semialdehyde dehydrogenase [Clostridium perfringens]